MTKRSGKNRAGEGIARRCLVLDSLGPPSASTRLAREQTLFSGSHPSPTTKKNHRFRWFILERVKGFEPSTSTLARLRSTPELRPHLKRDLFYAILL